MSGLDYLDFEIADDGEGVTTFDALADVEARHAAALRAEVKRVLDWATARFGAAAPLDEGGEWDCALDDRDEDGRTVVALTLSGGEAFAQAFQARFSLQ